MNSKWIQHDRGNACPVPASAIVSVSRVIEDGTNGKGFYAETEYKVPAHSVDWGSVDQYCVRAVVEYGNFRTITYVGNKDEVK